MPLRHLSPTQTKRLKLEFSKSKEWTGRLFWFVVFLSFLCDFGRLKMRNSWQPIFKVWNKEHRRIEQKKRKRKKKSLSFYEKYFIIVGGFWWEDEFSFCFSFVIANLQLRKSLLCLNLGFKEGSGLGEKKKNKEREIFDLFSNLGRVQFTQRW